MRVLRYLPAALLSLQLVLPAFRVIAFLAGMELTIYNEDVFVIISSVLMLAVTVALWFQGPSCPVIYLLLPPAALLNSFLWLGGRMAVYLAPINVLLAITLLLRRGGKWKIAVCLLCILPSLSLGFLGAVSYVFSGWSEAENTMVQELPSPEGYFTAQVIYRKLGLTNDSETIVTVQDHRWTIPLLFGELTRPDQSVYSAKGNTYESMTIQWVDTDTLIINGEYYELE